MSRVNFGPCYGDWDDPMPPTISSVSDMATEFLGRESGVVVPDDVSSIDGAPFIGSEPSIFDVDTLAHPPLMANNFLLRRATMSVRLGEAWRNAGFSQGEARRATNLVRSVGGSAVSPQTHKEGLAAVAVTSWGGSRPARTLVYAAWANDSTPEYSDHVLETLGDTSRAFANAERLHDTNARAEYLSLLHREVRAQGVEIVPGVISMDLGNTPLRMLTRWIAGHDARAAITTFRHAG